MPVKINSFVFVLPKPNVQVPDTGLDLPGTGSGSSQPALPDVGGTVGEVQKKLPVQTPGVKVPETGTTVPGTGLRLP